MYPITINNLLFEILLQIRNEKKNEKQTNTPEISSAFLKILKRKRCRMLKKEPAK